MKIKKIFFIIFTIFLFETSNLHRFVLVVVAFPARKASMVLLGYQAATDVTDVMAVRELKVIKDCRGRLGLRDLLVIRDLLV